jgi:hypothetical protein
MTSPIGLSDVCANVVVLLALAAAVASPRLSQLARLVITTLAFVCAWLITAAFDAARAPDWTMYTGGAVIVASIALVIATLHLWTQAGDGDESEQEHGDEGGGGLRRRWPDAPQDGGGGSDPSWWPEFERQLALHVANYERETRLPAVLPAEPAPHAITSVRIDQAKLDESTRVLSVKPDRNPLPSSSRNVREVMLLADYLADRDPKSTNLPR